MAKPKKKKFPWVWFILLLLACQYLAAHISGWLLTVGEWDIAKLDSLAEYFTARPLDVMSFHPFAYLFVYAAGLAFFCSQYFKREPPKAEMKGEEHGSNDFMSHEEIEDYVKRRITPDFPYSLDCRVPAEYVRTDAKKGG